MFGLLTVLPAVDAALHHRQGKDGVRLRLSDGVTSVSADISLPRNGLVHDYRFLIQARRAGSLIAT